MNVWAVPLSWVRSTCSSCFCILYFYSIKHSINITLVYFSFPDKCHTCHQCNASFLKASHLKSHSTSHSDVKPYVCDKCGKCFALKWNLFSHRKYHFKSNDYKCSFCHKLFKTKSNQIQHSNSHTKKGRKNYHKCGKCSICSNNKVYCRISEHMKKVHNISK